MKKKTKIRIWLWTTVVLSVATFIWIFTMMYGWGAEMSQILFASTISALAMAFIIVSLPYVWWGITTPEGREAEWRARARRQIRKKERRRRLYDKYGTIDVFFKETRTNRNCDTFDGSDY